MELLTREQQHLITEDYVIEDQDAVRFQIVHESYVEALREYNRAVSEYSENSRQAQNFKNKLERYTRLYQDFVQEMDSHYGKTK